MDVSGKRGVALLEVLVALVVLTSAALGLVEVLAASLRAQRVAAADVLRTGAAADLLTAVSLYHEVELTQRLGRRTVGSFVLDIERPAPALFRIGVLGTDGREVLVTVLYRPAGS